MSRSLDDFVELTVKVEYAGSHHYLFVYEEGLSSAKNMLREAGLNRTQYRFENVEFWTNYTAALRGHCAGGETITIFTGPGSEFAVLKSFIVRNGAS